MRCRAVAPTVACVAVPTWFDFTHTELDEDGTAAVVRFYRGKAPSSRQKLPGVVDRLNRADHVATLTVRFYGTGGPEIGDTRSVALDFRVGALTTSFLQRFPWEKWVTAADAFVRSGERTSLLLGEAVRVTAPARGRPGRRGHHSTFLPTIAKEYRALRLSGEKAPVQLIAERYKVSRNTAAGWIKQARQKDLLPPGRPNRAG